MYTRVTYRHTMTGDAKVMTRNDISRNEIFSKYSGDIHFGEHFPRVKVFGKSSRRIEIFSENVFQRYSFTSYHHERYVCIFEEGGCCMRDIIDLTTRSSIERGNVNESL